MMADLTPMDIAVSRARGICTITWSDRSEQVITLADLRRLCPCSLCSDQRDKKAANPLTVISGPEPSAQLLGLERVGGYAIRFQWADGHNSGIYTYEYLHALAGTA